MHDDQFSRDELQALAAEVAERIISDPSLAGSLADRLGLFFKCPPHKLCCFVGYGCDPPFGCLPEFNCTNSFVIYPPLQG
jgi:hypothetical protein